MSKTRPSRTVAQVARDHHGMILAVLRIAATSLAVVVTATLVAGCGGSGHSPAEAHLAALANGVCREVENMAHMIV
jgi:hypothetical protein